jgi:hypothetical protein
MNIAEAVAGAENSGCMKAIEVACNAARMVDRRLTGDDVDACPILMTGALEILLFQVGNGRLQTPFMRSVYDFYYRTRRISVKQAAAVINVMVDSLRDPSLTPVPSPTKAVREGPYAVYKCVMRGCRDRGREFDGALPSDRRKIGFGALKCRSCGDVVVLVDVVNETTVAAV